MKPLDTNNTSNTEDQPLLVSTAGLLGNPLVRLHPRPADRPVEEVNMSIFFDPRMKAGTVGWQTATLADWARRWNLPLATLAARLRDPKGCWPVWALRLPVKSQAAYTLARDGYVLDGEHLTFAGLAQRLGLQEQSLKARLLKGWSVEQAVSIGALGTGRPKRVLVEQTGEYVPSNAFEFRGVVDTLRGHCERLGYNYLTVLARTQDRRTKIKRKGVVKEFFYPGVSKEQALAAGRRKSGPLRRTRADKGKPREHLRGPDGPYSVPEYERANPKFVSQEYAPEPASEPPIPAELRGDRVPAPARVPTPVTNAPELDLGPLDGE